MSGSIFSQSKFSQRFRASSRGFTLIEIVLVLGAITALSAGSFAAYKVYNTRSQTTTAVESSRYLSNSLMQTYGQAGSFANLSTQSVIDGNLAPNELPSSNNNLKSPWGGTVTVAPSDVNNNAYAISWNSVPSGPCANMVSQLNKDFAQIKIDGAVVKDSTTSTPLNMSETGTLCGASNSHTVVLTSNTVALPNSGEVALPTDNGASVPVIPTAPSLAVPSVSPVTGVTSLADTSSAYQALPMPSTGHTESVGSAVAVTPPPTVVSTPPTTSLPPQTCFSSTKTAAVSTTLYGYQTLGCAAGYAGSISQDRTQVQTVTTTTVTACATPWSIPVVTATPVTSLSAWSGWTTTANTCAAMCSTQLAGGGYPTQYQYQWVTVNPGCPAGYMGSNYYQVQQSSYRTASCANPSGTAAPVYGGWSGWANTGATQGAVYTCVPSTPSYSGQQVCATIGVMIPAGCASGSGTSVWESPQVYTGGSYTVSISYGGASQTVTVYTGQYGPTSQVFTIGGGHFTVTANAGITDNCPQANPAFAGSCIDRVSGTVTGP